LRVLLDECVDRRLAKHLQQFATQTVHDMGWATIKNGELLALAQLAFDVFVTVYRNLAFQQHLPKFDLAVIVLSARTNRLADLLPLVTELVRLVPLAPKSAVTTVGLQSSV
jgi:hypothetical protein